jgi:phosphate-selective porin OprO/OprP
VDRNGESDPDFYGWYGYASWFLTGESRPYKNGVFSRVKPKSVVGKGGHGAWELAARVSKIDLTDSGVDGGDETDVTLGVNWYATPSIRFMLNYVNVIEQEKENKSDEPSLVEMRAQIDF